MRTELVAVAPGEPLRRACELMVENTVSACVVRAPEADRSPGIVTTRDVLKTVAAGADLAGARVEDHSTPGATCADPAWPLERVAEEMVRGGFRHLPVVEHGEATGIVSIRDVVRLWSEQRRPNIEIRDAMTTDVLTLPRDRSVRQAVELMSERRTGSAVVEPARRRRRPGLIAERDIVDVVARGRDPDSAPVEQHLSPRMTFSAPDWSLKQAAQAMLRGGFLHIVVVDGRGLAGIISMRDILRRWYE